MKRLMVATAVIFSFIVFQAGGQEGGTVVLQKLYATSTALDYEAYGPHHLFDGKPDPWVSMPGAGVDDGVMLIFEKPEFIGTVEVAFPEGKRYTKIESFIVYIDGTNTDIDYGIHANINQDNSKLFKFDRECTALYLRIKSVSGMASRKVKAKDGGDVTLDSYAGDKPVALSEITLFGKENNRLKVIPPRVVKGKVEPGSTLKPEEAYHAGYLFDFRTDSAWVEGREGEGTGEVIGFSFPSDTTINRLRIWNGMHLSETHYKANERVKTFSFFCGQDDGRRYALKDAMVMEEVTLASPLKGKNFTFRIDGIYPGTKYKDTVISDLQFGDDRGWFIVDSCENEARKRRILSSLKGSILDGIVDRFHSEYREFDTGYSRVSVVLRSDSSFVIWFENVERSDGKTSTRSRYLDGFWMIKSSLGNSVSISLLGRNYDYREQRRMYQEGVGTSSETIFSDTVVVTRDGMKGKKAFDYIMF